ncbi:MAG: PorT family protein [Bacteroidetes bacterium]|nr:PorT family protein [Fibrella sp.]
MKKLFLSLSAVLLVSTVAFAQLRVGTTGSLQFARVNIKTPLGPDVVDNILGFQAGILLNAALTDNFSLRPQLLYSAKGFKRSDSSVDTKALFNYVEMPVQLMYAIKSGPGRFALGAGPYIGYGLGGKTTMTFRGESDSFDVEFGSERNQLKRLDIGLYLSAGYELASGLILSVYHAPGLTNLSNAPVSEGSVKNTAFGASVGFLFCRK